MFANWLAQGEKIVLDRQFPSSQALAIAQIRSLGYLPFVICTDSEQQSLLMSELRSFCKEDQLICLPSFETLPCELTPPSADVVGLRMKALASLLKPNLQAIVLVTVQSLQQSTPPKSTFQKIAQKIEKEQKIGLHAMASKLLDLGFTLVDRVTEKGQFAKRQSLIDLFVPSSLEPVRIEWWGDEIDSLRIFDPSSQSSRETISYFYLLPAQENLPTQSTLEIGSILDYLPSPYATIFSNIQTIEDHYVEVDAMPGSIHKGYLPFEKAIEKIEGPSLYMCPLAIDEISANVYLRREKQTTYIHFEAFGKKVAAVYAPALAHQLHERFTLDSLDKDPFFSSIHLALEEEFDVILLYTCSAERLQAQDHLKPLLQHKNLHFFEGYLSQSLVIESSRCVLASMSHYNQHVRLYRPALRISHSLVDHDLLDLSPGDSVVHLHHGIGLYRGIEKRPDVQGIERDLICLEYAQGSKIFIPIENAHLITRYQNLDQHSVELHLLGATKWKKQWAIAQESIGRYAQQLLELYASRLLHSSPICPKEDSLFVQQFESSFPYEMTEDQVKSMQAIKADLSMVHPMDRLICGDVGYGKTEVAMRAAFKMIVDAKCQVVILAPTTVLALQHYETFTKRMHSFGVRLAVLSRFTKPSDRRRGLEELEKGTLDLIIGTHRLLSADVKFHNLGLLIIDEEQRFGVQAKEHLKLMKQNVNCLTLSATPIPRTLHLSLMGSKQLSTIATPPHDRQPITTIVCPKNDETLRSALLRELSRGGQAFYIRNEIDALPTLAIHLQKLVPHMRLGLVHGQMESGDIESIFHDFKEHRIDLLIATTIVETGIDIPNANTLFIDGAQDFGLADLYQLRGRVGRWNRKAYAYFLYPPKTLLSVIAKKRLDAIQKASGYGSGMKLALQDLSLRGFGDLIGTQQSGQVSTIGFSLYCRLLQRAMKRLQGLPSLDIEKVRLDHNLPLRIPENYIEGVSLRLEIYQRSAQVSDEVELEKLRSEIIDRFGPAPESIDWLLLISKLRIEGAKLGLEHIKLDLDIKRSTLTVQYEIPARIKQRVHVKSQVETTPSCVLKRLLEILYPQQKASHVLVQPKIDLQSVKTRLGLS